MGNEIGLVTAGESAASVGFTCIICDDAQALKPYFYLIPNPPICDKCIQALKEIILEKRKVKNED